VIEFLVAEKESINVSAMFMEVLRWLLGEKSDGFRNKKSRAP
jgi:GTPase SAR1 family protein